jgi:hypothetical protein
MDKDRGHRLARIAAGFAVAAGLAACSAAGATASPSASMMEEHSPSPSASMMEEHSPSPSASAASPAGPISSGAFHAVDGTASGTVALFHRADGSFVITFEDFAIASAAGTNVILVPNRDVTADGDIVKTSIIDLGPLKGTSGMQDFTVPASADAMTYHAVVLWDTGMAHAIAAAPLK